MNKAKVVLNNMYEDDCKSDRIGKKKKKARTAFCFLVMAVLLVGLIFVSVNLGSLQVTLPQLFRGLFIERIEKVAVIYDLRFPRIIISLTSGAAVAVSGVLFQAILKNPLADPGIIGISGGAGFAAVLVTAFLPTLYFVIPLFAFAGGGLAFFLVYSLSWKGGLSPLRIILTGVAVSAMFTGLTDALNSMTGGNSSGVAAIVEGNITQKTWNDVQTLVPYVLIGLILSLFFAKTCNLMLLEDKTVRGLGINVNLMRIMISLAAVLLAGISTAVAGSISFLGLIVPHIGRIMVGSDHRILIPFSMLAGAFIFLLADTIGRTVAVPYEISASVIMSMIGGPFFIILLRRSKKYAA